MMVPPFLVLFFTIKTTVRAQSPSTCFWPNGNIAQNYVPCNTNATSGPSSCCAQGEACLQNSLCYGGIGDVYRGACTNWAAGNNVSCPRYCADDVETWANFAHCYDTGDFWCGAEGAPTCKTGNGTFVALTGLRVDHLAGANSSTAAATIPSPSSSGTNTAAIAVGTVLGAVIVCLTTLLWWQRRHFRRTQRSRGGTNIDPFADSHDGTSMGNFADNPRGRSMGHYANSQQQQFDGSEAQVKDDKTMGAQYTPPAVVEADAVRRHEIHSPMSYELPSR